MEFNEKLLELRRQKGLTQEELAQALYVSRTAVSKWESGRGYPSIDSLRAMAKFFSLTVDELLSGDEVLCIAEEDRRSSAGRFCDLVFGLLDVSAASFFFLPLFGQEGAGGVYALSLLQLSGPAPYLMAAYHGLVAGLVLLGLLRLALQGYSGVGWLKSKNRLSLALNIAGLLIFIMSRQPYGAALLLVFLTIKLAITLKQR